MTAKVEPRAPRVRCYECGSPRIRALCHHCWRPGCAEHATAAPPWAVRMLARESSGGRRDKEVTHHCQDCAHVPAGRRLTLVVVGAGLAAVGLAVAWLSPVLGLVLVLLGTAPAGGVYLQMRAHQAPVAAGALMWAKPKVSDLCVTEILRARITLGSDGRYETDPRPVEGQITGAVIFGRPDRDILQHYLRKHPGVSRSEVRFCAGRLVLGGPVGIRVGPDFPGPVIPLEGETGGLMVFRAEDPHTSSTWKLDLPYQLSEDPDISAGLIWVTPALVPRSDERMLELEIQWPEIGPEKEPFELDVIEELQLRYPVGWGNVEQVSHQAILGTVPADEPDRAERSIEWKQLSPTKQERQLRRVILSLRFESKVDRDSVLPGNIKLSMRRALSGVEDIKLFSSRGGRRSYSPIAKIRTRIEADFSLSLASLRYQAIRHVPDRTAAKGGAQDGITEFDAIPDDDTVIELTNAMSEDGYYVKRVIENPPRSGGRASRVQRYWDIAGRRYKGVYPIDFHIVLTGEEVHRGGIKPEHGTTRVRITVHGAYTDSDMYRQIGDEWRALCDLTAATLSQRVSAARPRTHPPAAAGPAHSAKSKAGAAGSSPAESAAPPSTAGPDDGVSLEDRLLRRLGLLDEALAGGRITHEEYREMRDRAQREFGG